MGMTALTLTNVDLERGELLVCADVSTTFQSGELVAIVGPNGAGKSSMIALLAGDLAPSRGTVTLDGVDLAGLDSKELARRRAVMTQANDVTFPFSVRDVVEMGRYPWAESTNPGRDAAVVEAALHRVEVSYLADRKITALSGGERARVALARVLAQETEVLLLDEPTASLDIRHQELVMQLLREKAAGGALVIVVLHDLEAAAAFADRIVLLADARVVANGSPIEVLTPETLSRVYQHPVEVINERGALTVRPNRSSHAQREVETRNPQPIPPINTQ
jgi:iron complex transport system ATP-binding protein